MKAILLMGLIIFTGLARGDSGTIPAFRLESSDIALHRLAQPGTPFDKVGRRFAILGDESGSFEAWAYPLKLFRNARLTFFVGNSTRGIPASQIVRYIDVSPAVTTLTFTYQSFTVKAHYIVPIKEPGGLVLLEVDASVPLKIVVGFVPVLQPMWPAGLGGQYAYWNQQLRAYVISESSGNNHALFGSPAGTGISYTPAHMLSDYPNEFVIDIPDPDPVRGKYIPIIMAGGRGERDSITAVYQRLARNVEAYYQQARAHYRHLRQQTMKVQTPVSEINLAFEWAKIAYDNLVVDNPDLGTGLVAGLGASGSSGRPGFGWFFGGDAYINALSLNSLNAYSTVRDALAFTRKWQREDGKMAHELTQAAAYVDWWKDYHYGYIHGDTTPYYIVAMWDYVRMSGDVAFLRQSWESIVRAYRWCLQTDANKDGLMDNRKAGLGATEYGAFTGVETDIYLGAIWVQATRAMAALARIMEDQQWARTASADFQRARKAFDRKFWDPSHQMYSFAFNARGERVTEVTPWCAVGLMWELGQPERSLQSLEKIATAELTTDWGVRSLSIHSKFYQPLNYNYGAVWPFLTSWVTTAQFKHHQLLQGFATLMSTVRHTFDHQLGAITEVFSGSLNVWPQEAVAHQGFSTAGVVLPFVRGLLGLEGDAIQHRVQFMPHFPPDWREVHIRDYRVGESRWNFHYFRRDDRIELQVTVENGVGYRLDFAPALAYDAPIEQVRVNGQSVAYQEQISAYLKHPEMSLPIQGEQLTVVIQFQPSLEFLPVTYPSRTGEANRGLKVVSLRYRDQGYDLLVEGLAGERYGLPLQNAQRIKKVRGARLQNDQLQIEFPEGAPGEFKRLQVRIELQAAP
ncbi:MAG: hypothetical protein GXO78_11875 [Calditrichaeota bacterium]|nr:hypothetical protein [Calditrichota bacterium]